MEFAALLFLTLPLIIFFAGFTAWFVAMPAVVVIMTVLCRMWPTDAGAEVWQVVLCAVLAAVFLWACAYLPPLGRSWDWLKHFALVNELARNPWPPVNDETHTYLRYALGYYMVPGLAARLFGEQVIEAVVFLETWIGLVLVLMLLLQTIRPSRPALFLVSFLLFGGLDLLGWYFIDIDRSIWSTKEWWIMPMLFAYEGHATLFLWVPQHALAGMLGLLLILSLDGQPGSVRTMGLLGSAMFFWSPFAAIGLLPFALAAVARSWRQLFVDPGNILCSMILGIPLVAYLLPGSEAITRGWSWSRSGFSIGKYAAFVMLEAGLYILALYLCRGWQYLRHPAIVIIVLLLLPLYQIGIYNDFTMRACIPALMLIAIAVAATVSENEGSARVVPLAVLLAVGIAGSIVEIVGRGNDGYVSVPDQSLRTGFLRTDAGMFVQYNAPLPNWVLRR